MHWFLSKITAIADPLKCSEFTCTAIFRWALLSEDGETQFAIFDVFGPRLARRVANVSDPEERELLEYVSATYYQVYELATEGKHVPVHRVDRAKAAIDAYFNFIGRECDDFDERFESHILDLNELATEEL